MKAFIFSILVLLFFITSCNKNDVITEEIKQAPIIELDSETGIYTIKVGRELTIAPTYKYANNALYAWTVDGKLLSSESILKYTWNQEQHLYIKLRVDTPEGYAEEELKVEVLELTPPTISIIIPSKGLKVPQNTDYILSPDIQHDDLENFRIEWVRDGEIVGTEKAYTFHEKELGTYSYGFRHHRIHKLLRIVILLQGVLYICGLCWNISIIHSINGRSMEKLWKPLPTGFLNSRRRLLENISLLLLLQKKCPTHSHFHVT